MGEGGNCEPLHITEWPWAEKERTGEARLGSAQLSSTYPMDKVPVVVICVLQRAVAQDARVVHNNVNPAIVVDGCLHQLCSVLGKGWPRCC